MCRRLNIYVCLYVYKYINNKYIDTISVKSIDCRNNYGVHHNVICVGETGKREGQGDLCKQHLESTLQHL